MEYLKALLLVLVVALSTSGASSVTIGEALQLHLDSESSSSSWEVDLFLTKLLTAASSGDELAISPSQMEMLNDVFMFVPDSQETLSSSVLQSPQLVQLIQEFLDKPSEDLLELLKEVSSQGGICLAGDDAKSCYSDVSNITTTVNPDSEAYEECSKDLKPLYLPLIHGALTYLQNTFTNVDKHVNRTGCRFPGCPCTITIPAVNTAIEGIKLLLPPLSSFPKWGWQLLDAMAKPPPAILGGQLQWVGGYEKCNSIEAIYPPDENNATRSFKGKYCRVMIGQLKKDASVNDTDTENGTSPRYIPLRLGFGLCIPDTCTTDGVVDHLRANPGVINTLLNAVGLEVESVFCGGDHHFDSDSRAQLAFGIIVALVVLVLCATVYDLIFRPLVLKKWTPEDSSTHPVQIMKSDIQLGHVYANTKTDQMNGQIATANGHAPSPGEKFVERQSSVASTRALMSVTSMNGNYDLTEKPSMLDRMEAAFAGFSASVSFRKIFDVTNFSRYHIPCIDGLRFLSVVYAIGGNTCLFGILYTESNTTSNLFAKLLELPQQFAFQPVINYTFSTDTFLVVSGTMVSYHWLRRLEKTDGKLGFKQVLHYYLHRYWSLLPVMMLVIMTYTCLYQYLLSGPMRPPFIQDAENCRTNWWINLLMLGNLVDVHNSCLAWTWYVPMMFQLYIVTPIILIPLSYKRIGGWISLICMYLLFVFTVSGVVKEEIYGDNAAWYYDYIMKPWCRAGPYLIGVGVGILLYDRIPHKIPRNICTKLLSWALLVAAIGMIVLCAFITYTKYREVDPVTWTEDQSVTYHVFIRSAWGLAIAYMILASEAGFGGIINSTLSHRSFTPASRLAYPVFVVHAIFIFKYAYSQYDTIYVNFNNLLYMFFGHLIMVFLIGMVIGIFFFYPFQGLEYAFFGAKTRLDIMTAGTCAQEFRELKLNLESSEDDTPSVFNADTANTAAYM